MLFCVNSMFRSLLFSQLRKEKNSLLAIDLSRLLLYTDRQRPMLPDADPPKVVMPPAPKTRPTVRSLHTLTATGTRVSSKDSSNSSFSFHQLYRHISVVDSVARVVCNFTSNDASNENGSKSRVVHSCVGVITLGRSFPILRGAKM